MKQENVFKILEYINIYKNEHENVESTQLSLTNTCCYITITCMETGTKAIEIVARLYIDEEYFNVNNMVYKDFAKAMDIIISQERIRRHDVLYYIK